MADNSSLLTFSPVDLTSVAGAAVNGIAGLLGMSGQSHYQRKNMRYAADLQHAENVYWAEYNTPENQMARLRAAGLNPMLVYGNGADAQAQGSVSPSGGMPSSDFKLGSDILMMQNMLQQNKNLEEQNKLLKAQAEKEKNTAEGIGLDNAEKRARGPERYGEMLYNLSYEDWLNRQSARKRMESETQLNEARYDLERVRWDIENTYGRDIAANQALEGILKNKLMQINLDYAPAMKEMELKIGQRQADELAAKVIQIQALAELARHQALLVEDDRNRVQSETDLNKKKELQVQVETGVATLRGLGQHINNDLAAIERDMAKLNLDVKDTWWNRAIKSSLDPVAETVGKVFGASASYHFGVNSYK